MHRPVAHTLHVIIHHEIAFSRDTNPFIGIPFDGVRNGRDILGP
jgi:hypothetical protein